MSEKTRLSQASAKQGTNEDLKRVVSGGTVTEDRSTQRSSAGGSSTSVGSSADHQGGTVRKSGKKAVISTGGKQYLVREGEELEIELLAPAPKASFEALLVIDGDKISVGTPFVTGAKVDSEIIDQMVKGDKVVAIRYKAKKRVHKIRGHRQRHTKIKIKTISIK